MWKAIYKIKIERAIDDLSTFPFFFDLSEFDGKLENITFKFLKTAIFPKYKRKNTPVMIRMEFSQLYSNMLFQEQTIRRNRSLCIIDDPLAFFLINHIEPTLIKQGYFNITLAKLIKSLDLQKADWHNFKSTKMRQFKKTTDKLLKLPELRLSDGSTITSVNYYSNKDKNDYIMKITTSKADKTTDTTYQIAI
ncbi:hypothetical protein AGMMS50222_07360 [Endomicrobiia bacterium]|nr:hypothetical protein AGMMS49531_04950 [Endomicrobiia bacterium]GHT68256.1 hypothetical protein AGMMS49556_10020 [Endomicrobiia bacterium]GHT70865.1 hypothetical protein AGMMS49950_06560 [Endomicrobiia bacterium]GHT75770.1 hypothetical protein AGMMS50222_07360 [Endomicrobiia bacterium]